MNCVSSCVDELETDGWLVNQTRMWLASQWTVRSGAEWTAGEDRFFTHLLDGSRAANRLGWQWTVGAGTGKPYGFSRWQVRKRAPQLCRDCALSTACPIQDWPPDAPAADRPEPEPLLRHDPDPGSTGGPRRPGGDRGPGPGGAPARPPPGAPGGAGGAGRDRRPGRGGAHGRFARRRRPGAQGPPGPPGGLRVRRAAARAAAAVGQAAGVPGRDARRPGDPPGRGGAP